MAKKSTAPSSFTLYSLAIGAVLLGGTVISLKSKLFPEPLAGCTERYVGGLMFPAPAANAQPVSLRDVQSRLGFDEWGLIENATLAPLSGAGYPFGLKIVLAKGSSDGAIGGPKGGIGYAWKPGIQGGASAACLSYAVWLPEGFNFNQPGVLPGLYGGDEPREGGKHGFGARFMWSSGALADILMTSPSTTAKGVQVASSGWPLATGRWVKLEQEIQLNTPGKSDGMMAIWIDGVLRGEARTMQFRNQASVRIDGVLSDVHYLAPAPEKTSIQLTSFNLRWRQ